MFYRGLPSKESSDLNLDYIREMYTMAEKLANWLKDSNFPDSFPPKGSHEGKKFQHNICIQMARSRYRI